MIIGEIKNIGEYTDLPASVLEVLSQISLESFHEKEPGVYTLLDGSPAKICEYETKTGRRFASHRTYADLTYIVSGEERLTVGPAKDMTVVDYDAQRDV